MTDFGLPVSGSPIQRRLAAAAVELFYRQGAIATSVRQITEACGLTPGALYNHFESKDELLYAVVRDIHLRLEGALTAAVAAVAGDPVAELSAIVRVYVARHSDHRETARVANREFPLLTGARYDEVVAIRRLPARHRGRGAARRSEEAGLRPGRGRRSYGGRTHRAADP